MRSREKQLTTISRSAAIALLALCLLACAPYSRSQEQPPVAQSAGKAIGAIKSISGATITVTPDSGTDVSVSVPPGAQIVRVAPGEKSLGNAVPIQLQDLQVGDRIRATGTASAGTRSLVAAKIVAIRHSDLEARHAQDLQDWNKRGVDGLATAVDPAAGSIAIAARNQSIVIHTSVSTVVRRYPPDSVKFDDTRPGSLKDVHSGDQVRARGERSADGKELAAEEIVSGSFRNIAGTINSVDAASSTIEVHDLLSKKNVVIKVTADSQLRRLPPEMAQRIATRLKAGTGGPPSTSSAPSSNQQPLNGLSSGGDPGADRSGGRSAGTPDFQQMLSRLPASSIPDLHKGDAVVMVSTQGMAGIATAITLLSGVEPILQAAPGAGSSSILSPWSLSAPANDSGGP